MKRRAFLKKLGLTSSSLFLFNHISFGVSNEQPLNILWIVAEDMLPNWSCFGEKTIKTPNIDRLAREGVRFTRAFVTCPVCSPSRSALISGMYQTKLGAHNHRSQQASGKGAGDRRYMKSHRVPVKLLPQLFQENGYYTVLGGKQGVSNTGKKLAKSDYNFIWNEDIYNGNDWSGRKKGQPFFAQIQLKGGKARNAKVPNPVDPQKVKLPPYYPDHPVMRKDWAEYLNSVLKLDEEVGEVLARLEREGLSENTVVFLFTDHGISHLRGKQFLYDEGIRVPLIVRWPGVLKPGTVRDDLVSLIDVSVTSLAIAGIPIPEYMDGRSLFASDYKPREYIAAARDRCDETIDCIRCIRTDRFKYIRNYFSNLSHMQPNQYKDGKKITQIARQLFREGKLTPIQARIFAPHRPPEELYDLKNDPYEINNLADHPEYQEILKKLRRIHLDWMKQTRDLGLIPEPILEEMGMKYGNKYFVLQHEENLKIIDQIREVIELREKGPQNLKKLVEKLKSPSAAVRFRAAYEIGNFEEVSEEALAALEVCLNDPSEGVSIAAARALCLAGKTDKGFPILQKALISSPNHVVRHYAALFFEETGNKAKPYFKDFKKALQDNYEFVRRVARRLVAKFST